MLSDPCAMLKQWSSCLTLKGERVHHSVTHNTRKLQVIADGQWGHGYVAEFTYMCKNHMLREYLDVWSSWVGTDPKSTFDLPCRPERKATQKGWSPCSHCVLWGRSSWSKRAHARLSVVWEAARDCPLTRETLAVLKMNALGEFKLRCCRLETCGIFNCCKHL